MNCKLTVQKRRVTVTCLIAATAVNLAGLSVLWGLFDSASQMPWLLQNDANEALLERCSRVGGTGPRRQCVEHVVQTVQRRASGVDLAGAGSGTVPAGALASVKR